MRNKNMVGLNTDFSKIVPYTKLKLDCYQNMVVTLLNFLDCEVEKLGAVWPWRFGIRVINKNVKKITNQYVVTEKKVDSLFGYGLKSSTFSESDLLSQLLLAAKDKPIIINLDQYYVPHHYKHIYNKEHGQHSLLIIGQDKASNILCVDALPEYKGIIDTDKLLEGMINFPTKNAQLMYSYLDKGSGSKLKSNEEIFNDLVCELESIYNKQKSKQQDGALLYLSDILLMVQTSYSSMEFDEFLTWMAEFCNGTWIWEIDRAAKWLISYLNTDYPKRVIGYEKLLEIVKLIEQTNYSIVAAMRLYYKTLLTKSQKDIFNANEKLKAALNQEEKILKILMNKRW